uniref:Uncharacterized protein n=1 Tax=Arundo donax TaxID=35708 RepID=A0A0A9FKA7_ARUDO
MGSNMTSHRRGVNQPEFGIHKNVLLWKALKQLIMSYDHSRSISYK